MSDCLSTTEVIAYLSGTTPSANRPRLKEHLEVCEACKQQVAQSERVLFRSSLRTTLWIIGIGMFVGGPAVLGFSLAAMADFFAAIGKAYAHFPSVPVSRLATADLGPIPTISWVSCVCLAMIAMFGMGWLVAAIVRPRRIVSSAALVMSTGIVAGLAAYLLGFGWAIVIA